MTDRKISELPNQAPADTDEGTHISGGMNYRFSFLQLRTWLSGFFATSADLTSHTGDTNNPHATTATQVGAAPTVHVHDAADVTTGAFADARIAQSNVTQHQGALTLTEAQISDLKNYAESPLSEDLATKGSDVLLTRLDDSQLGVLGAGNTFDGWYIAYSPDGSYDPNDAAVAGLAGRLEMHGSVVVFEQLKHTDPQGYEEARLSPDGTLYGVSPPEPGWTDPAVPPLTDAGTYNPKAGGLNVWQPLTGLDTTVQQAVAAGSILNMNGRIYVVNPSAQDGNLEIGFGVNGAQPTVTSDSKLIQAGYASYIPIGIVDKTGYAQNDVIRLWARVTSESNTNYAPSITGTTNNHEITLSAPAGGGGGGETNLGDNVGTGAEVFRDKTGVTLNFRSLVSGDASVTFTQNVDELDIRATGAGGGEANTQTNQGAGVELGLPKNGVDLPIRTLDPGQFELNVNQVRIPSGTFVTQAYETIQDNSTPRTQRPTMNFTTGIIAGDDAGNNRTNISTVDGEINHDALLNYDASQHVAHPLSTDGDLLSHNGTAEFRLPIGTVDQVLTAEPGAGPGLKIAWKTIPGGSSSPEGYGEWLWSGIGVGDPEAAGRFGTSAGNMNTTTGFRISTFEEKTGRNIGPLMGAMDSGDYIYMWSIQNPGVFGIWQLTEAPTIPSGDNYNFANLTYPSGSSSAWTADDYAAVLIHVGSGGGGGGISKGATFVLDDLLAVSNVAGDGEASSVGFAPTDVGRLSQNQNWTGFQNWGAAHICTPTSLDSSTGPFSFGSSTKNSVTFTGTSNVTINLPSSDGEWIIDFASVGNITLGANITEVGTEPATARRIGVLWRQSASLALMIWGPDT